MALQIPEIPAIITTAINFFNMFDSFRSVPYGLVQFFCVIYIYTRFGKITSTVRKKKRKKVQIFEKISCFLRQRLKF